MQGWEEYLLGWHEVDIEHPLPLASCFGVLVNTSDCKDSGFGSSKEATFYSPIVKAETLKTWRLRTKAFS